MQREVIPNSSHKILLPSSGCQGILYAERVPQSSSSLRLCSGSELGKEEKRERGTRRSDRQNNLRGKVLVSMSGRSPRHDIRMTPEVSSKTLKSHLPDAPHGLLRFAGLL